MQRLTIAALTVLALGVVTAAAEEPKMGKGEAPKTETHAPDGKMGKGEAPKTEQHAPDAKMGKGEAPH